MNTPDLPPPNAYFWTPKPESGLRPELKSWSTNCGPHPEWDIVGYYTTEEVAAAVLAEREKSEAMRAALVELLTIEDRATVFATLPITQRLRIADRKVAAIDAARDAIRTEPKKEKQP